MALHPLFQDITDAHRGVRRQSAFNAGDLVAIPCGVREEEPFSDGTRQGTARINDGWGLITVDWEGDVIHDGALHGEVLRVQPNGSVDVQIISGKVPRTATLNPAVLSRLAAAEQKAAA